VTGFPYDIRTSPEKNLNNYARFSMRSQVCAGWVPLRWTCATWLRVDWKATGNCGRFLGYGCWRLIAEQAGALVTKADGDPDILTPPFSILAANRDIHPLMLKVLLESASS